MQVEQALPPMNSNNSQSSDTIIELIKKIGQLRDAGVLSDDEFNSKKSELLSRL